MLHWPIKVMTGVLSSTHKAHTHLNSVWLSNLPSVLTPYICLCNTVILIFTWYSALLGEKKKCTGKLTGHFDIIKWIYLTCLFIFLVFFFMELLFLTLSIQKLFLLFVSLQFSLWIPLLMFLLESCTMTVLQILCIPLWLGHNIIVITCIK